MKKKLIEFINRICVHDWAYNKGFYPTIRKCMKCGKEEFRDLRNSIYEDTITSDWYKKI